MLTKFLFRCDFSWFEERPAQSDVRHFSLSSCVSRGESCIGLLPIVIILNQLLLQGREREREGIEGRREMRDRRREGGGGGR